jgi:hypothetical protein
LLLRNNFLLSLDLDPPPANNVQKYNSLLDGLSQGLPFSNQTFTTAGK